jgi:organic hydroperoxide reductase OsmC/OhrA
MGDHIYKTRVVWTGDLGEGTRSYRAYGRDHKISAEGKPAIPGSSDPVFRGDGARWNPAELLLASISACHQLWYLHLCADAGVVVTGYVDDAEGVEAVDADGSGRVISATLRPKVTLTAESDQDHARALHAKAHEMCFIANSLNFQVTVEPSFAMAAADGRQPRMGAADA